MITKVHLLQPGELRGYYLDKPVVERLLYTLRIQDFAFLRPFSKIEFTIRDTQEIPGIGYLLDGTILTIHFIKN